MTLKRVAIYLVLLGLPLSGLSQQFLSAPKHEVRVGYAQGEILQHSPELSSLEGFGVHSLFADFSLQTDTSVSWAVAHTFPKVGATVFANRYESPSLGYSYALIPYVENSLPLKHKRIGFYYHLGLGLGYQTMVYDSIENANNRALTAAVNIAFDLRLGVVVNLTEDFSLLASGNLLHYSNGATRLPNYGINVGQLNLGLSYQFSDEVYFRPRESKKRELSGEILVAFNAGLRQLPANKKYYPVQNLAAEYNLNIGQGDILGLGLSLMNNAYWEEYNVWAEIWGDGTHKEVSRFSTLNFGPYLNYEFRFGRFSAVLQNGLYLFNANKEYTAEIDYGEGPYTHRKLMPESRVFNRLGFRYRFGSNFLVNLSLKSHLFKAQNLELGVGTFF